MNRLFIYKGLLFLTFILFIFGAIIAYSSINILVEIKDVQPETLKVDKLVSSHTGSSRSGDQAYTAYCTFQNKVIWVGLSGDGANTSDYLSKDSLDVWIIPEKKYAILRDINPTQKALRDRHLRYLFVAPAGIMIYPFLIILPLFLWEKRKQKCKKAKKE